MTKRPWTPGPWKRGSCDNTIIWANRLGCTDWTSHPEDSNGERVSVGNVSGWGYLPEQDAAYLALPVDVRTTAMDAEREANATLIAAAPDLYEALEAMADAIESGNLDISSGEVGGDEDREIPPHPWHHEWLHHARAALAKAGGAL